MAHTHRAKKTKPTIERLNEMFYLRDGEVVRKIRVKYNRGRVGDVVRGTPCAKGYLAMRVDCVLIMKHHVVFALANGYWPVEVDHVHGNILHNAPEDIREVTTRQNNQNRACHRAGKLVGAFFNKRYRQPWRASIRLSGKKTWLGGFDTELAAHEAYRQALQINGLSFIGEKARPFVATESADDSRI